ncbi:MAG TPA: hypothetical protein VGM43_04920 [Bryobacteraceae bacterium]
MLRQLIRRARRRLLWNEALKQFALSAALAIAGVALLLTLGTRYIEWWVVALFAAVVAVWAVTRLRKRVPSEYSAAVWLDEKSGLHDALSTAHYFSAHGAPDARTEALLAAQRGQAESMAGNVDVSIAVPFRFPKALYGLIALLLLSTGLVTVRYFYGHNLDLRAPITEVIFEDQAARTPAAAKPHRQTEKQAELEEARSLLDKLGLGANLTPNPDQKLDQALADALRGPETTPGQTDAAKFDPNMNKGDPIDQPKDNSKNSGTGQAGDRSGQKESSENANPQSGQSGQKGEKSEKSLLSKLKEAMDNMINAPSQGEKKNNGGGKQQKSASQQAEANQEAGQQGDEQNQGQAQGEANGATQKSNSPGQTSGNSPEKQEGPSAAGSQDGEKAIRLAEQTKAMGKIAELIGKRSDQVTGESMIEVQSGNQHVQTAYKEQNATHGEGAGEVSRDQIPLSVQAYVQEYFQEVRKPEGKAAASPAAPKKKAAPKQ